MRAVAKMDISVCGLRSRGGRGAAAFLLALLSCLVLAASAAVAAPGTQLWVKRYNGPGNGNDLVGDVGALGVSPDGSKVFVTGSDDESTTIDYATVAYAARTGARLWVKRYHGSGDDEDHASALGVSPDGSKVFVTGSSVKATGFGDYATVAYDASTGMRLWAKRYDAPASMYNSASALGVSPDGSKVFVTGTTHGSTSDEDYATVAYDAATGAQLWATRYNGPAPTDDLPIVAALGVSPDGAKVFVTGGTEVPTGADYATVAYDASTGTQLWATRYNGPGISHSDDSASALGVSNDGSKVFVTGGSTGSTGADYATVAYDASTGAQLWATRYSAGDSASALGVSNDGSKVFVTGFSDGGSGSVDYATVAYAASTGARLWARRYNGPRGGDDYARALGVSADGSKVFVTGGSRGSTSSNDYATLAYDATTGTKLWVKRYNGPANRNDVGYALGVGPHGAKVFVTGRSLGGSTSYDYATVAYSIN
jgi:outer membrane protein assembly factor BamB